MSPSPLGGERRVRGAAGATSSLWVRPPSPFDSACAVRPPLSLILSPGGGEESGKGDAPPRPCRHAVAARGGDKQEPDAPLPSFPRALLAVGQLAGPTGAQCHGEGRLHPRCHAMAWLTRGLPRALPRGIPGSLPQRGRRGAGDGAAAAAENHAPNEPGQDGSVTAICN